MAFKFNFNELTQYNNAAIVIVFIFGMIYYINSYDLHESMENANIKDKEDNLKKFKTIEWSNVAFLSTNSAYNIRSSQITDKFSE